MKAIILTAGYGRRMRPLTNNTHKTLLTVAGKTILARLIDALHENGVTDIVFVTGYQRKALIAFLAVTYPSQAFQFVHNSYYAQTNNIYSMSLAFEAIEIDDDILLIESDLVCDPIVIQKIIESPYPNVALVDKFRRGMDGTVVTVADKVISSIIPPHLQGRNFDFSDKYKTLNIYKFSQTFCNKTFKQLLTYYAQVIDDNCYYELILGMLIYMQQETIHAEVLTGERWAEIDDANDLRVAEYTFNEVGRRKILEDSFGGFWNYDVLDFCFIRNMYFPGGAILSEMRSALPTLLHNYGSKQPVLNQKLAYHLLYKQENLQVLNGASQIYPMLQVWLADYQVLIPQPSFGEYPRIFPNRKVYGDEVGLDTDEIERLATDCQAVVLVNPNNPTGSTLPSGWIYEFAQNRPEKTIVVDESFIEFAETPSIITLLEEKPLDNVIVIKSLSKSLGMPGLRLGYVYATSQDFQAYVRANLPIWNLNAMAEYFLEVSLKHRPALHQSYQDTIRDRERFAGDLRGLDFVETVYLSGANFLLVSFKNASTNYTRLVDTLLARDGIYIKDVSPKFSKKGFFVRLSVRLPGENARLIKALQENIS